MERVPSEDELVVRLQDRLEDLPPGIPARYLARAILTKLTRASPRAFGGKQNPLSLEDLEILRKIPAGIKAAGTYHNFMVRILSDVFGDSLRLVSKEVLQFGGRKRIDIVYQNVASAGFFFDLHSRHQVPVASVMVECKNYAASLKSPEFDQLSGRLNPRVGAFGILVCRKVANRRSITARCHDYLAKGENLIVLDDVDLESLIRLAVVGDAIGINDSVERRFREVRFG